MGPSTSTKAIPEVIINYVKHQHTLGVIPTRENVKQHLKGIWELQPWAFGVSNEGLSTADWDSSVYPTFRSMYAKAKNKSGGQKGLECLQIITVEDIDWVFHTETWLKYSAGASLKEMTGTKTETIRDVHTTAQFTLCSIAQRAGLKVYVPNKDRTKKADNGMSIAKEFSEILVNDFIGINHTTKEIDVIFLTEEKDGYQPVKAFEVENSTGVKTGLVRLKALNVKGTIVSTQKAYRKIFDESISSAFSELKDLVRYAEYSKVVRFSETISEFENSIDKKELLSEVLNKI